MALAKESLAGVSTPSSKGVLEHDESFGLLALSTLCPPVDWICCAALGLRLVPLVFGLLNN